MTTKRYLTLAGVVAAVAGLTLAVLAILPAPDGPGVTRVNFGRIKTGMTDDEVQAIIGVAPSGFSVFILGGGSIKSEIWLREDGACVDVTFRNGFVSEKRWTDSSETAAARMRRWLRLPWW